MALMRSALLGSAAGLVAGFVAQAADLPMGEAGAGGGICSNLRCPQRDRLGSHNTFFFFFVLYLAQLRIAGCWLPQASMAIR